MSQIFSKVLSSESLDSETAAMLPRISKRRWARRARRSRTTTSQAQTMASAASAMDMSIQVIVPRVVIPKRT